ncbi:MAG TPA: sugar transferase [Thermodesulfobacteriaceae bacterium]|nr:sugar transferase [Thermodesulfobacteriaceae bacterium]
MYRDQAFILSNIVMILDAIVVIIAAYLGRWIYLSYFGGAWLLEEYEFVGLIIFAFFLNNTILSHFNFYSDRREPSLLGVFWGLIKAYVVLCTVISTGLYFIQGLYISKKYILIFSGLLFSMTFLEKSLMRGVMDMLISRGFNQIRILLVGSGDRALQVARALQQQRTWGHKIVGLLTDQESENPHSREPEAAPVMGKIDQLRDIILREQVDEVIFALPSTSSTPLKPFMSICEEIGVSIRIVPAMFNPKRKSIKLEVIQGVPLLCRFSPSMDAAGLFYKRIMDILVGAVGTFICFVILYPIIGLAIKLDSRGPVLFKQKRVGMRGRIFNLYKFRSMHIDAEERKAELMKKNEMSGPIFKMTNDPRITRVGRFIRKTSLDEFPQFWNILKGEMSLVGTRPPTPEEVDQYDDWHRRRISIKPGLTGLWQISGRNKIRDFNEIVRLDLQYIDQWRLIDDIKILWRTLWIVAMRKGAK